MNNLFAYIRHFTANIGTLWCLLWISSPALSQHDAYSKPVWPAKSKTVTADSNNLLHAFLHGTVHGHFRQFTMSTINHNAAADYWAVAAGGGLRYQTASFHHFRFTLSGYFTYNLASSNLSETDPASDTKNRYEIGLFDITNPNNRHDLDRLEELNLQYANQGLQVTAGKQILNTPFINPQDGRMRPTEVSGLYATWKPKKNNAIEWQAGFIHKISPRSTTQWYTIAESMSIYPKGVDIEGNPSGYANKIQSDGIALAGMQWKPNKAWKAQWFSQWITGVMQSTLLQTEWRHQFSKQKSLMAGLQYIYQSATAGRATEDNKADFYFEPETQTHVLSGRLAYQQQQWITSINHTRIMGSGRYLSPREWGRDPFYTFMPRERNEGFGDLRAWVLKSSKTFTKSGLQIDAAIGLFDLPEVSSYAKNKYGMPSYGQLNTGLGYSFAGWLQGMSADLLYVYKWNRSSNNLPLKYLANKADMSHINLILNYHF